MKKIVIVGAGAVGAHVAYASILRNLPAEFYMVDLNEELEQGQVLDLRDSLFFSDSKNIHGADFGDKEIADADIYVITAGVAQKPGETRTDLLKKNAGILKSIRKSLGNIREDAVVLLISNPLDVLTEIAHQIFELPRGQVFGSGTLLDTSRMRWHVAEKASVHPKNVAGFVMGEHGDSEFIPWSRVRIAGKKIKNILSEEEQNKIEEKTQKEAYEIINRKGATYFGIGAAASEILATIVHDQKIVLPVSTHLDGEYGISDICLGVPAVVGAKGAEKVWELHLEEDELKKLQDSGEKMKELLGAYEV